MFNNFITEGSIRNDFIEGLGTVWEGYAYNNAQNLAGANNANVVTDLMMIGIPGGSFQTVLFKP